VRQNAALRRWIAPRCVAPLTAAACGGARGAGTTTVPLESILMPAPAATAERTLLIRDASCIVTMNDAGDELRDASVLVRGARIAAIGPAAALCAGAGSIDDTLDARGLIVLPGLVNTHHHMFQTLTRALPAAQDAELFGWLRALYPVWSRITPPMLHDATLVAMAELLRSGCTTSADHHYLFPNGCRLEDTLEAAARIGMRFHATRGAMSVGESDGGLPPDALVEREDAILRDTRRLIEAWHDPAPLAMRRIGVAPCSPFSVSRDLMRESAALARAHGVRLHTHLAENDHDVAYSREKFGCTPAQYAEDLGWLGPDVWHAHCVKLDDAGIDRFAATATGVAHCPCSNMRLASGIAPVRRLLDAGVPVGLGVDGSASNDAGDLLAETRQALLLARVGRSLAPFGCDHGPREMTARDALRLATRGGAQVLGRDDIGHLAPDMAADLALFDLRAPALAGAAVHDPVASLVFCAAGPAVHTIVNGQVVVRDGRLTTLDLPALVARHDTHARALLA
jgi:cytosine/adenosine deaminase-related metal-dependent hydrolase